MSLSRRQQVIAGLFVAVGLLTLATLSQVLGTVFFAVTVAYVLYPVRRELRRRDVPRRLAAAIATAVGFVVVVAIVAPIVYALYGRRTDLLALVRSIPAEQPVQAFGMTYVVDVSGALLQARRAIVSIAVDVGGEAPVLGLKFFLFLLLVYGLLLRPGEARRATMRLVPPEYHDIVERLHVRVRDTLYALYVLQAATALGTFLVAYPIFWLLGYDAAFSLAFFSGILQFIPVIGPSLLVLGVAGFEALAGDATGAVLVAVLGMVFIGFLPDAIIRPQLAQYTTGMPASLYFIGFTGGTLTIGIVGVIAGPLVVALLVEVVQIVTDERGNDQRTLRETVPDTPNPGPPGPDGATSDGATSDGNEPG